MTDFMSKAHALRNAVNWNSNSSVEVIAEALRDAYSAAAMEAKFIAGEDFVLRAYDKGRADGRAAGQQDILRRLREPSEALADAMYDVGALPRPHSGEAILAALTAAADAIEREIKGE